MLTFELPYWFTKWNVIAKQSISHLLHNFVVLGLTNTASKCTESQGVDFGVDEILDAVPTKCPTKTREVDHDDGSHSSMLLRRGLDVRLIRDGGTGSQEEDCLSYWLVECSTPAHGRHTMYNIDTN